MADRSFVNQCLTHATESNFCPHGKNNDLDCIPFWILYIVSVMIMIILKWHELVVTLLYVECQSKINLPHQINFSHKTSFELSEHIFRLSKGPQVWHPNKVWGQYKHTFPNKPICPPTVTPKGISKGFLGLSRPVTTYYLPPDLRPEWQHTQFC